MLELKFQVWGHVEGKDLWFPFSSSTKEIFLVPGFPLFRKEASK